MQLFSSWTGSDFLLVYIVLLAASGGAAWWIPQRFRPSGRHAESPDAEDIAMLRGGGAAHTDSLLADLLARGGIEAHASGRVHVIESRLPASPAGRALLGQHMAFTPGEAERLLAGHHSRIAARLRRAGLLLSEDQRWRLHWLSVVPLMALFLAGLYRLRAASALGEATGVLVVLLGLTALVALLRFVRIDPRTTAGIETLQQLQESSAQLRRRPPAEEAGMAVALFGTGVLVGTPWDALDGMRRPSGDGGGNASGDGSSGDCAGDGGGCGD